MIKSKNYLEVISQSNEKISREYREENSIEKIIEDLKKVDFSEVKNAHLFNLKSLLLPEEKTVIKIEKIHPKLSLDLSINHETHSYIANGIPVHNTCNIPNDYSFEDFKDLYLEAHNQGLIGFTTYRDGTMEAVLSKIEEKEEEQDVHIVNKYVKLPDELINGTTKIIKREGIKFYIHFSYLPEDKNYSYPVAIWITTNHTYTGEAVYVNRAIRSLCDLLLKYEIPEEQVDKTLEKFSKDQPNTKLAKSISMCLRHNLPIPVIINALENLEGDNISSLLTAVRKFLASHIKNGTKISGKKCTNCGSTNLVYESSCAKCIDCGTSGCG